MTEPNFHASPGAPHDVDPVTGLARMSRTAGAGTTEYVAVNTVAVAALVFGVASALALLNAILLIIPLTAIVLAIVALRQIRRSGGTQTGALLAWGGLLLAILLSGARAANVVVERVQTSDDRKQVIDLVRKLSDDVSLEKFNAAYELFDRKFQARVGREQFDRLWHGLHESPLYGKGSMASNGLVQFDTEPDTGTRTAVTMLVVTLEKSPEPDRLPIYFRRSSDHWLIEKIPAWFPPPPSTQTGAPPMMGP